MIAYLLGDKSNGKTEISNKDSDDISSNASSKIVHTSKDYYIVLLIHAFFRSFYPYNNKESHYCPSGLITVFQAYLGNPFIILDIVTIPYTSRSILHRRVRFKIKHVALNHDNNGRFIDSNAGSTWYSSKKIQKGVHTFEFRLNTDEWRDSMVGIADTSETIPIEYNNPKNTKKCEWMIYRGNRYYIRSNGLITNELFQKTRSGDKYYDMKVRNKSFECKKNDVISVYLNCNDWKIVFRINGKIIKSMRICKASYAPTVHIGTDNLKLTLISHSILKCDR